MPYGSCWTRDRSAYQIDPTTGPIVERIVAEALDGQTLRAIARALSDDRISTPKGGSTWSYTTIAKILKNSGHTGHAVVNRYGNLPAKGSTRNGRQRRLVRMRPESDHVVLPDGVIPPLDSPDAFDGVAEWLRLNAKRSARNNHEPD